MELYKLIATINNGIPSTFTFDYLPENFEGVKISQKFSFVNPMGYTPKFSIETMRVIEDDKVALDAVFFAYGLQGDVEIEIQKLNATGTAYVSDSIFAIDFESYDVQDEFSEFALKSISVIDKYNAMKNTEMQIALTEDAILPNTQKYINYVSLKRKDVDYFGFEPNNESKIYNGDYSLYSPVSGGNLDQLLYVFGANTELSGVILSVSASINILITNFTGNVKIRLVKYNSDTSTKTILYTFLDGSVVSSGTKLTLNLSTIDVNAGICAENESIFILNDVAVSSIKVTGEMFIDIKRVTIIPVVTETDNVIKFAYTSEILDTIFNGQASYPTLNSAITSASHLSKLNDFATIKPKEFLSDFCLTSGLMLNFKLDGNVSIDSITNIFNALLDIDNAIEITDYKELSIRHTTDLNFASVSVGQELSDYEVYTYLLDWNKVLTFAQANRNASENLDLTLTKLRTDFSGILDYFVKRSQQKKSTSKDNFIFNPAFTVAWVDGDFSLYDFFTPRNILANWNKFLSFCFQNFGLNTLTISSNGGTSDNLNISGTNQMDNLVLAQTPRLLPFEYNLTALIPDIDFSEKILKIDDKGETVYLFVIEAETTDTLSEQKIKGLKIQF